MDFQFWIWLIVIILTFLSQARKKKQQQVEPEDRKSPRPDVDTRPVTFEELLREIQASKSPKREPVPQPSPVLDYDDELPDEEKSLETVSAPTTYKHDDSIYDTYERAKQEAFARQSLEESLKLEDTIVEPVKFKGYQSTDVNSYASAYAEMLKDPATFKQAFIVSEILRPKF